MPGPDTSSDGPPAFLMELKNALQKVSKHKVESIRPQLTKVPSKSNLLELINDEESCVPLPPPPPPLASIARDGKILSPSVYNDQVVADKSDNRNSIQNHTRKLNIQGIMPSSYPRKLDLTKAQCSPPPYCPKMLNTSSVSRNSDMSQVDLFCELSSVLKRRQINEEAIETDIREGANSPTGSDSGIDRDTASVTASLTAKSSIGKAEKVNKTIKKRGRDNGSDNNHEQGKTMCSHETNADTAECTGGKRADSIDIKTRSKQFESLFKVRDNSTTTKCSNMTRINYSNELNTKLNKIFERSTENCRAKQESEQYKYYEPLKNFSRSALVKQPLTIQFQADVDKLQNTNNPVVQSRDKLQCNTATLNYDCVEGNPNQLCNAVKQNNLENGNASSSKVISSISDINAKLKPPRPRQLPRYYSRDNIRRKNSTASSNVTDNNILHTSTKINSLSIDRSRDNDELSFNTKKQMFENTNPIGRSPVTRKAPLKENKGTFLRKRNKIAEMLSTSLPIPLMPRTTKSNQNHDVGTTVSHDSSESKGTYSVPSSPHVGHLTLKLVDAVREQVSDCSQRNAGSFMDPRNAYSDDDQLSKSHGIFGKAVELRSHAAVGDANDGCFSDSTFGNSFFENEPIMTSSQNELPKMNTLQTKISKILCSGPKLFGATTLEGRQELESMIVSGPSPRNPAERSNSSSRVHNNTTNILSPNLKPLENNDKMDKIVTKPTPRPRLTKQKSHDEPVYANLVHSRTKFSSRDENQFANLDSIHSMTDMSTRSNNMSSTPIQEVKGNSQSDEPKSYVGKGDLSPHENSISNTFLKNRQKNQDDVELPQQSVSTLKSECEPADEPEPDYAISEVLHTSADQKDIIIHITEDSSDNNHVTETLNKDRLSQINANSQSAQTIKEYTSPHCDSVKHNSNDSNDEAPIIDYDSYDEVQPLYPKGFQTYPLQKSKEHEALENLLITHTGDRLPTDVPTERSPLIKPPNCPLPSHMYIPSPTSFHKDNKKFRQNRNKHSKHNGNDDRSKTVLAQKLNELYSIGLVRDKNTYGKGPVYNTWNSGGSKKTGRKRHTRVRNHQNHCETTTDTSDQCERYHHAGRLTHDARKASQNNPEVTGKHHKSHLDLLASHNGKHSMSSVKSATMGMYPLDHSSDADTESLGNSSYEPEDQIINYVHNGDMTKTNMEVKNLYDQPLYMNIPYYRRRPVRRRNFFKALCCSWPFCASNNTSVYSTYIRPARGRSQINHRKISMKNE